MRGYFGILQRLCDRRIWWRGHRRRSGPAPVPQVPWRQCSVHPTRFFSRRHRFENASGPARRLLQNDTAGRAAFSRPPESERVLLNLARPTPRHVILRERLTEASATVFHGAAEGSSLLAGAWVAGTMPAPQPAGKILRPAPSTCARPALERPPSSDGEPRGGSNVRGGARTPKAPPPRRERSPRSVQPARRPVSRSRRPPWRRCRACP